MAMYNCKFCNRECKNLNGLHHHEKRCKENPQREKKGCSTDYWVSQQLSCQYCNKICKNKNSLKQHECRCANNPNRKDVYKKGINVDTKGVDKGHAKGTIYITDGIVIKRILPDDVIPEGWYKGHPHKTNSQGHPHSLESRLKIGQAVSKSRKALIAAGLITPATNYKYVKSIIRFKDGTEKLLRSSYELMVAIYLDKQRINFKYEYIRLPYQGQDGKMHTYITDFYLPDFNSIIEVKGNMRDVKTALKLKCLQESAFTYQLIDSDKIKEVKEYLMSCMDIENLLTLVKERSRKKDYYIYDLENI